MDRGLLDIPAYLPKNQWQEVLAANGLDESTLAARYTLKSDLKTGHVKEDVSAFAPHPFIIGSLGLDMV